MPSAADAWSFNLRNHNLDFSDSDSDFDSGDASSNIAPAFDETKLLNDFDLSTREETVIYKPNPFNIARINAASRAQKFISSAPKPDLLLTSKSGLAKGTIIDCFRLQAQKSKLVAPSTSNDIDIDKPATPLNHHLVKSQNDNTPSSLPSSIPNLSDAKNNGHNKYPVAHIFPHIAPGSHAPRFRQNSGTFSSPIRPAASIANLKSHLNRGHASSPVAPSHRLELHAPLPHSSSSYHPPNALAISNDHSCVDSTKFPALASIYPLRPQDNIYSEIHDPAFTYSPLRAHMTTTPPNRPLQVQVPNQTLNSNNLKHRTNFIRHSPILSPRSSRLPAHKIASAKKHRDTTSRSARTNLKPNPYDSLPMGEGEEWGTLEPAKKKMKPENEFGIRTSSKFTLGSLGMDLGKGKKTGMSAESSRRVITFLPPPLDSKSRSLSEDETRSPPPKIVEDAIDLNYTSVQARNFEHDDHDLCASPEHSNVQHHITMVLLGGRAHKSPVTPARKISNPYPSPQVSALSVGDAPRDLEVPSGRRVTAIDKTCSDLYRPPSPPTSDPPQQNETFGRDTSIPLDIGSISRRYPGIQRMSRKNIPQFSAVVLLTGFLDEIEKQNRHSDTRDFDIALKNGHPFVENIEEKPK
ncbi:hypothetical protein F5879DRAFT_1021560 [Lentinula edodes]|nr:hypothetical protein F5879DRAFT_1021560 [Lentinula edodes]